MSASSAASAGVPKASTGRAPQQARVAHPQDVADHTEQMMVEHLARPAHRLVEHRLDAVEADPLRTVGAARRVVGHHVDRRIGNAELPGQRGLGHPGHPDHVGAVPLQAVDLGRRLEARPWVAAYTAPSKTFSPPPPPRPGCAGAPPRRRAR
jgi:hypothetical protein